MYDFKPFDKVLMRDSEHEIWEPALFSGKVGDAFKDTSLIVCKYCIPYEGNEHLAGTRNNFKPVWKPKPGELVAFSDDKKIWNIGFFREDGRYNDLRYVGFSSNSRPCEIRWRYCEPAKNHFNIFMSEEK